MEEIKYKAGKINIESDDNDIISSFLNGNESAFNLIVLKYQKKIYWIIRKMVIDHDDADDITQEVFIKLYRSLGNFRGESALYTYLYRMAVNYSLNHLKKNKLINSRIMNFDEESYRLKSDGENIDEKLDADEKTRLLKKAISGLPEKQMAVFNMRFYDNLSYDEISKILKTSAGGLKANYFHAVKKIGQIIKNKKGFAL
ncbi:MAG: sigma-70 family RNA polymerase sigma factor [Ignavibacteriae bacterium]|nr:sigma-70 family RNA polymerase sigma factor [Ignavibacteriota bacterium]